MEYISTACVLIGSSINIYLAAKKNDPDKLTKTVTNNAGTESYVIEKAAYDNFVNTHKTNQKLIYATAAMSCVEVANKTYNYAIKDNNATPLDEDRGFANYTRG